MGSSTDRDLVAPSRPSPTAEGATGERSRGRATATRPYRARRWPLRTMSVVLVAVAAGLLGWTALRQPDPTYTSLPQPQIGAAAPQDSPSQGTASPAAGSVPTSPATAVYIPATDERLTISTAVRPLDGCRRVIDPPRDGKDFGGVFGCTDYAQPGTDTAGLTVLAGHSALQTDTAFNRLYVQGKGIVGRHVYVRTSSSGGRWLDYRITEVHEPGKTDLPYLRQVWGAPGEDTRGRLVVVTCRQQPGRTTSVQNYVAVARLVGVR